MNDYIVSVLLGIVEGLTEFLPVSSTAHLRISEALLHINLHRSVLEDVYRRDSAGRDPGAAAALQGRIIEFFRTFPQGRAGRPHYLDASAFADHGRFRGHGDSVAAAEEDSSANTSRACM